MNRFRLREQAGADPQTYALGLKEVWEVCPPSMQLSLVCYTLCIGDLHAWHELDADARHLRGLCS